MKYSNLAENSLQNSNHSQDFEIAHYGKSSISVFQEIFTSTDEIFIPGGRLVQSFYEVLKFS